MQENTFTNNFSLYDDHEDETDEPVPRAPKITSEYYSRYEIMTELYEIQLYPVHMINLILDLV